MVDPPIGGLLREIMIFYTYVIRSRSTGKIYTGYTNNLTLRIKRHNQVLPSKKSGYTAKNKGPWYLVYKEKFRNRKDAMKREKELKSAKGREFIKKLIKGR